MRYYIKSEYRASIKAFRTLDTTELDQIELENRQTREKAYKSLLKGNTDYFYQLEKYFIYVCTLSARTGYEVQKTTLDRKTLEPICHTSYANIDEFLNDSNYIGGYITLKRA